jgi:argininosuccinate lyase
MDDTGRIRELLDWRARQILFDRRHDSAVDEECPFYVEIDRAHVVMLVERRVLSRERGRSFLAAVDALVRQDYAPLRGRGAPRGLYLAYERWLIETAGEEVGGSIHLGRSRNDINATVFLLRVRPYYRRLVRELLRLLAVLVRRAERYAHVTMPVYTHHQAALPITFGHYLAGVALALVRDLRGIEAAVEDLERCPLGAGAAGGTTISIDAERTARLLGFARGVLHSVHAVAARDLVLRLLGASVVLGITLSRLATDLQLWNTAEFDLIRFPDDLVGSSSMLPQKRNAFLLEHVAGRAGTPLGALAAAAMAMHATPFSNSVAVGSEGVKPLWDALDGLTEAVILARLVSAGAQPRPERMRQRAIEGFTVATELANRLVFETGLSFRQAHYRVGRLVTRANECNEPLEVAAHTFLGEQGLAVQSNWFDPAAVAARAAYGGGPAASSLRRVLTELRGGWTDAARRLIDQVRQWNSAARDLRLAVATVLSDDPVSPGGQAEEGCRDEADVPSRAGAG